MTILGAIITLAVFLQLGKVDFVESGILGISTYVICLGLTSIFNSRIVDLSDKLLEYLTQHVKLSFRFEAPLENVH